MKFEPNTKKLIILLQTQDVEHNFLLKDYYNKKIKYDEIFKLSDLHHEQREKLLNKHFFDKTLRYKTDEHLNKTYLINQYINFIMSITKYGIFNQGARLQEILYPDIRIRFNGVYCPKIEIDNHDFKAFKSNDAMHYFVMGYNEMYSNLLSKKNNLERVQNENKQKMA
tara:strand:- start:274 stop:777 length:504 start_codon:yes stop_codon:yes gene_type:complete